MMSSYRYDFHEKHELGKMSSLLFYNSLYDFCAMITPHVWLYVRNIASMLFLISLINVLYMPPACPQPMLFFDCTSAAPGSTGSECRRSCSTLDMACVSLYYVNCSCGSVVEHCVSSAKVVGSIPREHMY